VILIHTLNFTFFWTSGTFHVHTKVRSCAMPCRHQGGEEMQVLIVLDLGTIMGVSGQRHAPDAIYLQEKTPGTHWIGGWVDLRAGLDREVKGKILRPCQGLNPGRPVCSQTLYWLSHPDSFWADSQHTYIMNTDSSDTYSPNFSK
jgi:hypothetical protein